MMVYLLKSSLCLALLLLFFHVILEREKMHQFNRFYLLASMVLSLVAPFYKIYTPQSTSTQRVIMTSNSTPNITDIQGFDYMTLLFVIYGLVSTVLAIRFIKNLLGLFIQVKQAKTLKKNNATLVLVDKAISPYTFWNYIFINEHDYHSGTIEQELYTHEFTHVTQKHSLDILLIELLHILFWVNPAYLYLKKAVKLNHEFLADHTVVKQHQNTTEYQYLLLKRGTWNNTYYLASNLNYSLTKKRLLMMTKQSSRTQILLRKLAVIPLFVLFIFTFAQRIEAQDTKQVIYYINNVISSKDVVDALVPSRIKEVRVEKDSNGKDRIKVYLYKNSDVNTIPPPPPKQQPGIHTSNDVELYFVKNNKGITYYNHLGQEVTKDGKILTSKRTRSTDVLPKKNSVKVYKNNTIISEFKSNGDTPKFPMVKKGDVTNIPPPPKFPSPPGEKFSNILPPPPPLSPIDFIKKHKNNNTQYYYNGKKIKANKALKLIKKNSDLNIQISDINNQRVFKISDDPIQL